MSERKPSILREALRLTRSGLILQQSGLALVLFLLTLLWLRLPDASAMDVLGTVVLGLVIVAVAGGGESAMFLHLCARAATRKQLAVGTLVLLAAAVAWIGWGAMLDHLRAGDALRAGYFNSRFPHGMRHFFTYEAILHWQRELWSVLGVVGAGVLAAVAFVSLAAERPSRAIATALRCFTYWLVLVPGGFIVLWIVANLVDWTPGHGLRVEMMSLVLRLMVCVLVCAAFVSLLLAVLAVCVRRANALYVTPSGTPDDSQPRTAEIP